MALAVTAVAAMVHAEAVKESQYLPAFESAAGPKGTSMTVKGKLGGFVLGPNKLVFVDKSNQNLWLVTTQDGCEQPAITDQGNVVTEDAQGNAAPCHFETIQPINREKLSRVISARMGNNDIFASLPMLGPPKLDNSMNHMSNTAGQH
ncbi:MAG TPA: hypothetical protein VFG49_03570 [Dyella sp.]|uniref:hypothetical protein n=1 Tax=Dyella sp. TaxID=1869338 RepID=UPI002D78E82F|nr:hypothetical protein [Dyella sp.]HET6552593.1 hypothetical protein [Dyella sp.]